MWFAPLQQQGNGDDPPLHSDDMDDDECPQQADSALAYTGRHSTDSDTHRLNRDRRPPSPPLSPLPPPHEPPQVPEPQMEDPLDLAREKAVTDLTEALDLKVDNPSMLAKKCAQRCAKMKMPDQQPSLFPISLTARLCKLACWEAALSSSNCADESK
jgi:hypothetical protein